MNVSVSLNIKCIIYIYNILKNSQDQSEMNYKRKMGEMPVNSNKEVSLS